MKKLYYSIGEVSEITSIEPHVLRYWETIFDELSPRKNKAGNRTYKEKDITLILRLKELIQDKKYSTAGALKVIEKENEGNGSNEKKPLPYEAQKDLQEIRHFLNNLLEKL
ncbi:MAG: MerR family transcriptional regulator [Balneolaceae bacterium]